MANKIDYEVGFKVNQAGLKQLKTSLQELQSMKYSDLIKINDSDISSARAALGEIQREAANVEKALDKAFNAKLNTVNIQTFNQTLVAQKSNIQQVYNAFSKAGATGQAAFRNLSTQLLSTNVQLRESHALLDKMATTLGNTIKWNLASGAVNSLTRSVEQAWGYVKSLDTSLNDIRIVTGKSADEMAKFAVQANNAAKELGKTTTDYTNASLIYAQQGLNDQEIAARAAITLKAANVTGQSTDKVSEQLTAVWNGYKVTADEAELYVDRLAAIAATTASNLEELSTGMSKVASAAAAMGVGEDQLAAQLSTIISVTKQAPESVGTALRTVYARISDIKAGIDEDGVTLGNYSGKMADLGFNVLDATGRLRDMGEVMEEIGGRWQDLTREQQISLAQTMAGQRQYSNLIALFDNFEQYTEALNTAQNAAETLQEQQDIYMESTKAHLATLKASIENIYDSLIDSNAKDGINDLVDGLSTAADAVASLVDSIGGGEGVLKAIGAIGFSVFSDQIANSIQITIGNLQRARTQAEEFQDAIKMAQEIQSKNLGNQYTQFIAENQESLLKIGGELSPQEFTTIQNDLKQLSQSAGELEKTNEEIDLIKKGMEKAQIDLDEFTLKYGSFDQMLANPQGLETVVESLKAFKDGMQTATESQEKMIKAFRDFGSAGTEETFNALRDSMKSFVSDLRDFSSSSKDDLSAAFDLLPQGLRKTVQEASASLETLDFNAEGSSQKIKDVFANLNGAFTQQLSSINKLIAEGGEGQLQSLESKAKAIQAIIDQLKKRTDQALANAEKTIDIRNVTRTVAGINSMAVAIRQVQNLGSIWKNEDISKGQKVLQTVLNLSMSLPMFFSGLTKVGKAMGLFKVVIGEEAAASFAAVAANDAHAKSILGLKIATDGTTKAFQFFNVTILANPMIALAAAAGVAAAALGILVKRADEARKATIEANKAEIDSINQKQATRQANKELWKSLDELDQKYKNGEISRSELKSSTQELISQYQLEDNQIKLLTSSYNDLSTAIGNMHKKDAEENLESVRREKRLAENNVVQTMHGTLPFSQRMSNSSQYRFRFDAGKSMGDEPRAFQDALVNAGGKRGQQGQMAFDVEADAKSILELYNSISKVVEDSNQYMTSAQQQNSQYYQSTIKWLEAMRDSIEAYKAALQDVETYTTDFAAAIAQNKGKINFDSIIDVDTYLAQRNNLIEALDAQFQEEGIEKTEEELNSLVDSYLLVNYSQIYNKYAEVNNLIQSIAKDAGEVPDSIKKALSGLNQQQLDYISKIAPNIKDWDTFETILEKVSKMDFSNMAVINNDIETLYNQASDTYNKYQSLEQQVKGGKSISPKEFESLDPEIQGFFSRMANGTYKMTADAKTFYNTVNDLKLDGFYKTLGAVNNELEKITSLKDLSGNNSGFNYEDYDKSAATLVKAEYVPGRDLRPNLQYEINEDVVSKQLDYLDAVSKSDEALKTNVDTWRSLLEAESLGTEQAEKILEAYKQAGDQTENLAESEKILLNDRIALYHQLHDAMFPTDEDVDTGALQTLSETISDMAENSTELDQHLTEDARAAQDVAEAILRFDDAVTDVVDNYEDWIKVLNNGSESEKAEIVEGLRDAYADLLDLDGSSLSNEFLTSADNLNLMKAAIDGDIESYDELMSLAGQDIIAHLSLDKEQFNADLTAVQNQLDALNFQELEIGASLNTEGFLQACQNLVQNAGMTAQQATDYLASMGVDAEVIEQKATTTETKENTGWHAQPHELPLPYEIPFGNGLSVGFQSGAGLITTPTYVPDTQTVVDTKQSSNFALKVVSAHKSSGGNFKFTQAPNGGGSKGQARRSTPSKGGKGGGGGGKKGGGGKAAKPDTSKKDLKKSLEDERDIYHDINIELEQIDRNLERAQKKQDRLYGKQLLDNLNEQSRILEQHKQTLKEKQKLQEEDLKQQRKTLKNLGVTFDKYGNISNYMSIMGKKQAEVNALIAEENSMIEAYNKQTDADVKKAIAEQIAEQQKKVKAAQDDYKDLQNKIKNYDETMKGLQDTLDQVTEDAQKQVEINIQKFKMEVEIRLDMGQAERDWNKFRRQVLEHTDIIRDTDFHEIFNDALQNANDVTSYFDVHGSKGSIQMLMEQALRTRDQIEQINRTGTSEVYGDNKAQAMEDLQNYLNELMGQMEDVKKLIDDIDKAYLETIDDVEKQFDKQIEDYEFIGELIEHDMDLLSLLYGDKNYDAMNKYYETLEENNLKQLDSLKQQRDFWKQQWDAAMAAGDVQAAKQFEQRYRETIKNLNSLIEDSAKTIQDKYTNAINKIFDELDKKLTDGKGTDYLNTEWELMNKNADEYLDTINSAFAIQETERKYQQALNDTKSIKNQQALKNLMDEQLGILKNKEKITQYDIDRAEKLLQVEQARIALEDAQSAKTSMRLKRDSQGNYSYEFAADEGAIGDAQANLAAAQNDLYNFDKDAYKKNLDDMLSAYQDFIERSKQLSLAAAQGDAEAQEKLVLLREQFGEYINGKTEQNLTIRTNLTDSALKDLALLYDKNVENYQNMSDAEKKILMEDLIPAWDGGIQKMIDKVAGEGGFIPAVEQSFNKVDKATKDYQQELDNLANAAGVNLKDVKGGVDLLADAFGVLVQANDDLIGRMGEELTAVRLLREQAQGLVRAYGDVYTAAAQAVTELHNFVQAEQGAAAAYAQTAAAYESMVHRIQQANADYAAHPYGGGYTPPSGSGNDNDNSGGGTDDSGSGTDNSGNENQDPLKKNRRGNRGCFAAGTKIIMADQLVKNIEDIQVGDLVIAYNDETYTYEPRRVTKTFIHQNMPELVNIILSNGIILKITPGHPILTTEGWKSLDIENSWYEHGVQATLLKINDEILGYNGNTFVSGIYYLPFSNYTVYNLEVETCHTFLADGIVVHNVKVNDPIRFDAGGYTGDWSSSEGKIAILHEKQQVFNKDDTQKLLEAVQILREITFNSSVSLKNRMSQLSVRSMVATSSSSSAEELQQTVSISATFPNVNSKREIEEALSDLVNLAAQRRMRRG